MYGTERQVRPYHAKYVAYGIYFLHSHFLLLHPLPLSSSLPSPFTASLSYPIRGRIVYRLMSLFKYGQL